MTETLSAPVRERDAYDAANEYFDLHEGEVYDVWKCPSKSRYGYLFGFLNHGRFCTPDHEGPLADLWCGCPIQIRNEILAGPSDALTKLIRADEAIPQSDKDITPAVRRHLADIQRLVDREIGRTPPKIPE